MLSEFVAMQATAQISFIITAVHCRIKESLSWYGILLSFSVYEFNSLSKLLKFFLLFSSDPSTTADYG